MGKSNSQRTQEELIQMAQLYFPGGSTGNNTPPHLLINQGSGSKVWDADGNEYIDYLMGSGPMILGHAHPEVTEVVQEQVAKGTTFFANNEHAILLAEAIVKSVPCAENIRFTSSGSEATLYAMRAARSYTRKNKILKFEGGFHGMNDYSLMSMMPKEPIPFPQALPDSSGIPNSVRDEMLIAPFNDINLTTEIINKNVSDIAGVIVEPLQRLIPPEKGFLEGLREITSSYGIPLIFDEIVTGYRLAYGGAQEYYGVTPDLCTLGKIIAGGYPLAMIAGKKQFLDHFDPQNSKGPDYLPQIGTLNGNPIAAVAGLKTLEILRRPESYKQIFKVGNILIDSLNQLFKQSDIPAQIIGEPPVFDIFFTSNKITDYRSSQHANKELLLRFNELLLQKRIFRGDTKFYTSLAHNDEDISKTIDAFAFAIKNLRE